MTVFDERNIPPGYFTINGLIKNDTKCMKEMDKRTLDSVKNRRKRLRAIKKGWQDKTEEKEGTVYKAGTF